MAFNYPVSSVRITQRFRDNSSFYAKYGQKGHNGIDFAVPHNTPVYAADEGSVVFEGWGGEKESWAGSIAGIYIRLNHGRSFSGYAHLSRTIINKGQKVKKGQLIGYSGSSGVATGPHLHFEMFPLKPNFTNGYAGRINPEPYITSSHKHKTASPKKKTEAQLEADMKAKAQAEIAKKNSKMIAKFKVELQALIYKFFGK